MCHNFKLCNFFIFCFSIFFAGLILEKNASGEAYFYVPPLEVQSGINFALPIIVSQAENLAGIKLVMEYDAKLLVYEKTDKTEKTAVMMQVVNDRIPGKLILVMAGANGVSGCDLEVALVRFRAASGLTTGKTGARVAIMETEMVSGDLKSLDCRGGEYLINIIVKSNDVHK